MKKQMKSLIAVFLLSLLVCSLAFANELTSDQKELMEIERKILRMFQAGELDKAIDTYLMEDAIACPPGMDRIVGKEKQKVMFNELLKMEGVELSWEPIEAYVGPSNDMAYVYGSVKWKMPNEDRKEGKYLSIYVKVNDKWMNIAEIRNSNK